MREKNVTEKKKFHYEYRSTIQIFHIPLLHVNIGGRTRKGFRMAKGIIAIGNVSIGVVSLGLMSAGVFSMGFLTLGICTAIGALALSYMAFGLIAIGYAAAGVMAIGVYSIGMLSIGFTMSIGSISYGTTALGPAQHTFGDMVYYLKTDTIWNSCLLDNTQLPALNTLLKQENLPWIIRQVLEGIQSCSL